MAADWLPKTRPGIVSRTADGAYGEHLRNRTPGVRSRAVLAGETFEVWARRIGAQDTPYWRSWYLQDKQSRGLMTPEEQTNYLKEQGWSNSIPGTEYPILSKRHIPGFFGDGSLRDWQGQDWLARMQQLLGNLPAPLKNWLSNYPRLPQSTIPTPTHAGVFPLSNYPRLPQSTIPTPAVEYPAPGRPHGPSKPGYQNPFAWRRKNNGWW